jgi:hypothetical protein
MRIGMPGWIYAFLGPLCYANGAARDRQRKRLERELAGESPEGEAPAAAPAIAM